MKAITKAPANLVRGAAFGLRIFDFGSEKIKERFMRFFDHVLVPDFRISYCRLIASCLCYLITLFARSSTRTGIVRPICFAALRLMTNSNFVACCTGKSAGLAPFKILST